MRIAILGGTGPQGRGLAVRFARAGHDVQLGSRDATRASDAATELRKGLPSDGSVGSGSNHEVVVNADLVVVSVPFEGQAAALSELAEGLAAKTVVSCVNPIAFDDQGPYAVDVAEGSAAQQTAAILADSTVVAAFHHLSAPSLLEDGPAHDETVLVCGDDPQAKAVVVDLASAVAARGGVDAGPLRNARQLESLTAVLIDINRTYKARSGVAISGL